MKVVLIDDDKVFAEPLLWYLEEQRVSTFYFKSVDDLFAQVDELEAFDPDCIILDIMMPRGKQYSKQETGAGRDTGIRLIRDLKKYIPDTPVIIVSVRTHLDLDELVRKHGSIIKGVLCKPVTPSEIFSQVRKYDKRMD